MIKNIIFDIGGIFLNWGEEPLMKLLNKSKNEINKIYELIYRDSRFKECILGNLSQNKYMELLISENPKCSNSIKKILSEEYQEKSIPVIKGNIEELYVLKNKGYKIYFLSNITDISYKYIKDKLNILSIADGGVYSYQERIKKPSHEIFDILIKRYGLKKDETVFFDDTLRNVESGNNYGIVSYIFNTMDDVKKVLDY